MKNEKLKQNEDFFSLAEWDTVTRHTFEKYLGEYDTLPSYRKILSAMIKFQDMYQPLVFQPRSPQAAMNFFTGYIDEINEQRKAKRAQFYMNKKDLINTFDDIYGKRLVVTSRGHKIFYEGYPLAKLRKEKWDGMWTVVMYDIPEKVRKKRAYIRKKLMRFGFGSPQQSILISPLSLSKPAQELIEGEKMEEYIWVLRAKNILGMENIEISKRSWPIEAINHLYGRLLEVLPRVKKNEENEKLRLQWKQYFLAVNAKDPYLPFELLPENWLGEKCETEFVKLGNFGLIKIFFRKLL